MTASIRTVVAAAVCFTVAAAPVAAQDLGIPVGAVAPAAAVQTLDGKPANLSQWIGKTPVVLQFWATWCSNCKELEPAMAAAQRKYAGKARFVGVAVSVNQSPERVRRHMARYKLPMEVVYDHEGEATGAYDVPATSYVVVVDRQGRVVYTGVGGDQDIEGALRKAGV